MNQSSKNLCLFCASSPRVARRYLDLATDLGALCAAQDWRLIYGGGRNGLMGAAADAALSHGAEVVGVIPDILQEKEVAHNGLSQLYVVKTMHERQMKMSELGDAFVILPGGIGTLAEFFEIITWLQLDLHQKPIVLVNYEDFWRPLLDMLEHMMQEGFLYAPYQNLFHSVGSVDSAVSYLENVFSSQAN